MDKIREAIRSRIRELGMSDSAVSRAIGQHRGYIHEFLSGKQATIPHDVRINIAETLTMPLSSLGISNVTGHTAGSRRSGGLDEDAVPYTVPVGSDLVRNDTLAYYVMTSDALEHHHLRIAHGDILVFDLSQKAVDEVSTEKIVIAQCYPRETEALTARTIVREYVRPGLLITNRRSGNEIISMNDPELDFEVHIKGVFKRLLRE